MFRTFYHDSFVSISMECELTAGLVMNTLSNCGVQGVSVLLTTVRLSYNGLFIRNS